MGGEPVWLTSIDINRVNFILKKWSSDGERIFFETSGKLKTIELATSKVEDIHLPNVENMGEFAVSQDEKTIAFAVREGDKKNIWIQTIGADDARKITDDEAVNSEPFFF